jgi:ankyrin repeat protein
MARLLIVFLLAVVTVSAAAQNQALPRVVAPKYNDVMTPVVFRDLAGLSEVLALGKWPDKPDSLGRTPLMVALEIGRPDIAELLLKAGADPERSKVAARARDDREMLAAVETFSQQASVGATGSRN